MTGVMDLLDGIPSREEVLPVGSTLIRIGDRPGRIILLLEGRLEVINKHNERMLLDAPTVVGEISYLGQITAVANVLSVTSVRLRVIDETILRDWVTRHPDKMIDVYSGLSKLAISRLHGQFHERYVAVVAHDGRKSELLTFIDQHRKYFTSRALLATATTGARIEKELGIPVARRVLSGPVGGDQEIGALVSRGCVEAVFFYRDPLWAQPHQADVNALVRVCELANIPLATNDATARLIVAGLAVNSAK